MTALQDWTALMMDICRAQAARATYRNRQASQQVRDAAVMEYGRALDAVWERLDAMMESGLLAKITGLLIKRRKRWWF